MMKGNQNLNLMKAAALLYRMFSDGNGHADEKKLTGDNRYEEFINKTDKYEKTNFSRANHDEGLSDRT